MSDERRRRYWSQYVGPDGKWRKDSRGHVQRPPGEDLAALRSGLGREAGSVPKLWPYYTCEIDEWRARRDQVSDEQTAEHAALALYGLHQGGRDEPMHRPGVTFGRAVRELRKHEKFSEQAVDTRMEAAATATSLAALLPRLRGLITQLSVIGQPLDYGHLMEDIDGWQRPAARQRVRRKWGLGYYAWQQQSDETL